jgi:hypothetical protein
VKSSGSVNSTRAVRQLLVKGARTDIRDKNERLPLNLVDVVDIKDLQNELIYILVSNISITQNIREDKIASTA